MSTPLSVSYPVPTVTLQTAQAAVTAALAHAADRGWTIAVVVLDPSGFTVASARMDGVGAAILDIAADKAYTATLGKSSAAYGARMLSSPDLTLGAGNRRRFCAWEGGVPLYSGGALIGAMGVSGAAGPEDVECAEVACGCLGLLTAPANT